jgi:hypothetical protein
MNIKNIAALTLAAALTAPAFAGVDYHSPEAPAVAVTQTQPAGLTRAQVRAELVQVEKAGYRGHTSYPAEIQVAEAKVSAQNGATGVGGVADGSSDAGHRGISKFDWTEMYGHH